MNASNRQFSNWHPAISPGGRSILDLLLRHGPASQASLSQSVELSQPSIARLIGTYHSEGLVLLGERQPGVRGHPSVMVALNPDFAFSLGITIVGDAVGITIVDFTGKVRAAETVAMVDDSPQSAIRQLAELKNRTVAQAKIDPGRIVGAGAGFSGFMVPGPPPRFNPPNQLKAWAKLDIAEALSDALDIAVSCENDATAATVAEGMIGVGRQCQNFAYCHITNGFGGGVVADGRTLRGMLGNAGDFGGILSILADTYPSLDTLHAYVRDAGGNDTSAEAMIRRIGLDTPGVAAWIADASKSIGLLAFLLGHLIACEKVVIGGRLPPEIGRALAEATIPPQTATRNDAPFPLPTIVASEVSGNAVGVGAAVMPLQELFFR